MADDTQILMKIPQEIIDAQVRAAVVAALAKDPTALVRAVVDAAMTQKKDMTMNDTQAAEATAPQDTQTEPLDAPVAPSEPATAPAPVEPPKFRLTLARMAFDFGSAA